MSGIAAYWTGRSEQFNSIRLQGQEGPGQMKRAFEVYEWVKTHLGWVTVEPICSGIGKWQILREWPV